jgi:hypothetical protein
MGGEKKAASERTRPLREAWDELHEEFVTVLVRVAVEAGEQAAGAQAVQAVTECTRRLRDIVADFGFDDVEDDEDDDEAV